MVPGPDQLPAGEPRWSPFPVQDWATLPFDPLAAVPPPAAATPPDRRRWWVPLVVLLLLGALLATVLQWASTPTTTAAGAAATTYLPPDGHVAHERIRTRRGNRLRSSDVVTESSRSVGVAGLLAGDSALVSHFGPLGLDNPYLPVWRTTTTLVTGSSAQTTRFYRTDGAVRLLGESGPAGASLYTPGLVELPADVAPGHRWSSSGTLGSGESYRSDLHADAAPGGCLRVSGTLTVAGRPTPTDRTWCPGEGVAASGAADAATSTVRADLVLPRPTTAEAPLHWSDPGGWKPRTSTTVSVDPALGAGTMSGSAKPTTPVRTTSGVVVRVLAGGDLVGTRPQPGDASWVSVWRARPGADVVTLAAFGDVIVVTTTARQVLAYAASGVRLWQRPLTEIAPTAAVRLTADQLVLVSLDGHVQVLGIADGRPGWAADVGSDVTLAPAVGAGLVVVGDRGGTTTALDAGSGRTRWTTSLLATALTITGDAGGTVLATEDQSLHALRADDGRHRWLRHFDGTVAGLQPLGSDVVLASHSASLLLGPDGTVLARLDPFLAVTATADHLVGWGSSEASVLDVAGRVLVRWPLPENATVFTDRPATAVADGVLLFGSDWSLTGWWP